MKTVVLTVIYPKMAPQFDTFIQSINSQTSRCFDLLIINDAFGAGLNSWIKKFTIKPVIFKHSESPVKNRLFGLQKCIEEKYDQIICADSDEIMHPERVEKITNYFKKHPLAGFVYNNGEEYKRGKRFDLFFKDKIVLKDILDFNVLGYGALSLQADMIPFIIEHANFNVLAFDWWLASIYLLHHQSADFIKEIKNHNIEHAANFVGPVLDIRLDKIFLSIKVKKKHYLELKNYCTANKIKESAKMYEHKYKQILEVENYIQNNSIEEYAELVKKYFKNKKIYWWQDVLPLNELKGVPDAQK
ncbi:MAG: glycosyltransferase [Calditrichales bacterium]|nr:glycosyltransferase [Calditrichales bacterium]